MKLIEIKDNKLVEIPRNKFEVNDIVEYIGRDDDDINYIDDFIGIYLGYKIDDNEYVYGYDIIFNPSGKIDNIHNPIIVLAHHEMHGDLEKIGIYGITHELINDKLIKE